MELPPDQYATVDGHRLRYWESGSGAPLLLLHGLGNSALVWHKCMSALARKFRVFALDLPGHGLSDMPRVRYGLGDAARLAVAFMAGHGVDRFHVAGNSMGGNIATELALEHADRLGGVVLVDPAGLGKRIAWFLRLASVPGVGEYFERPSIERTRRLVRSMLYDPRHADEELVAEMYRYRQRPGSPRVILRLLRYGVDALGQRATIRRDRRLASISSPLLVLWGRQDRVVPVEQAFDAARSVAGASVVVFERCGHWPQIEYPDDFARIVTEFLGDASFPEATPRSTVPS